MKNTVAIGTTTPRYNPVPPYHPDAHYPELSFSQTSTVPNHPYRLLRDLFQRLDYDSEHRGTHQWNPLGWLVQSGQAVLLKPNFVISFNASGNDLFAVVTHPSILRALIDYVFIALKGTGRIIIADAPQMDCDWAQLMAAQQLEAIRDFYRSQFNFNIECHDLRRFAVIDSSQPAYSQNRRPLPGDPQGSTLINLGRASAFYGLPSHNYYGADYDRQETIRHHHDEVHEYEVSKTALTADVIISVPKMKVHKKVGVTLNLKGFVGLITNKNHLIHYRLGSPREGGDQLPDTVAPADRRLIKVQRWLFDHALAKQTRLGDIVYRIARTGYRCLIRPFRRPDPSGAVLDGGDWYGNDSAWRMTADLAKIIFFADAEGKLHTTPQRRFLCVVDGITGGENCGPLASDPKPGGCLVVGENPLAVDVVTTRVMGFDPAKLRQFDILHSPHEIEVRGEADKKLNYKPHPGWVGHIEA